MDIQSMAPYATKAWELSDESTFVGPLKTCGLNCTVDASGNSDYAWFPPCKSLCDFFLCRKTKEFWLWMLCQQLPMSKKLGNWVMGVHSPDP